MVGGTVSRTRRMRRIREERYQNNLCIVCGKQPPRPNKKTCQNCTKTKKKK